VLPIAGESRPNDRLDLRLLTQTVDADAHVCTTSAELDGCLVMG
jgi:hypothetical protein